MCEVDNVDMVKVVMVHEIFYLFLTTQQKSLPVYSS